MIRKEENLQLQVCRFLKMYYPLVIFTCDMSSGKYKSIGEAVKQKQMRSGRGLPDLMIFEPRGIYHGLFIELKAKNTAIYKQDGTLYANKHLKEQRDVLKELEAKGYFATFGVGLENTLEIIKTYMCIK